MSIYLIGRTEKVIVSAKLPTKEDADELRRRLAPVELIEVGWFSYTLMRRNLPTLAMLPLWR